MRNLKTTALSVGLLMALSACAAAPTQTASNTTPNIMAKDRSQDMTPEEIQERIDWATAIEEEGYEFWRRYRDRPTRLFRQKQDWYNPMILVAGGNTQPYFPRASADDAPTISAEALEAATKWAMERETQAFIVYHKGKIVHEVYMDGFHDTSPISSHSWVKTLHGIVAGFAVADGDIESLDDPVEKYIEEWKGDPRGKITVRQALENTTGLTSDLGAQDQPLSAGNLFVEGQDVNAVVLDLPLFDEPGTVFRHNNPNTQLAGMIIHRATGKNFAEYLSEKLWRPMGGQWGALRMDKVYGNVITYCCYLSAPADWMRIAHLLKDDGKLRDGTQLLPEGWVDQMLEGSEANPNYGFKIWIDNEFTPDRPYDTRFPLDFANKHSEPFATDDMFYLDGGGKVRVWISRKHDLIILRNGYPPPRGMGFDEPFLPNTIIRGLL